MSEVKAPRPPAGKGRLQAIAPAPAVEETPNNLSQPAEGYKDLSFKVSEEYRRRFRSTASIHGLSNVALLREAFQLWCEKNNWDPEKI